MRAIKTLSGKIWQCWVQISRCGHQWYIVWHWILVICFKNNSRNYNVWWLSNRCKIKLIWKGYLLFIQYIWKKNKLFESNSLHSLICYCFHLLQWAYSGLRSRQQEDFEGELKTTCSSERVISIQISASERSGFEHNDDSVQFHVSNNVW